MATARDIIRESLELLRVVGASDTVNSNDEIAALHRFNAWIDGQNTHPLSLFTIGRTQHPLVNGQQEYTIGIGGDFNQAVPPDIDRASVISDTGAADVLEIPIGRPLTYAQWQRIGIKTTENMYPTLYYYDKSFEAVTPVSGPIAGMSRVFVYPVPNTSSAALVIYALAPLAEIPETSAGLATELYLPAGYRRWFTASLALECADVFDAVVSPSLMKMQTEAEANVRARNVIHGTLRFPRVLSGGRYSRYDIYSDS